MRRLGMRRRGRVRRPRRGGVGLGCLPLLMLLHLRLRPLLLLSGGLCLGALGLLCLLGLSMLGLLGLLGGMALRLLRLLRLVMLLLLRQLGGVVLRLLGMRHLAFGDALLRQGPGLGGSLRRLMLRRSIGVTADAIAVAVGAVPLRLRGRGLRRVLRLVALLRCRLRATLRLVLASREIGAIVVG